MNDDLAGYKSPETYKSNDEGWVLWTPNAVNYPLVWTVIGQFKICQLLIDEEILLAEEYSAMLNEDGYFAVNYPW